MTSNEEVISEEITKQAFRERIWNYLEKNDLAAFPRPVHHRIPNFKGSGEAAQKLKELDSFLSSHVVKVNPDKPQEIARLLALEAGKTVLVPIPRLRTGLFQQIQLPPGASNKDCRLAASRKGFESYGKPIGLDSKIKVDLVIIGSVAVSKEGHRIGKGEGYADLEFAMMVGMNAVDDETTIITTVHDCQVFDSLPHQLFKSHDVPVDIILTPTQVITVSPRLSRPPGIIWNLLSERRLKEMPILQTLREQQIADGKDCTLKEVDSDVEETQHNRNQLRRANRNRERRYRKRQQSHRDSESQPPTEKVVADTGANDETNADHVNNSAPGDVKTGQRSRMFHRRKRRSSRRDSANGPIGPSPEPGVPSNNETTECTQDEAEDQVRGQQRRRRTRRPPGYVPSSLSPEKREEQNSEKNRDQYKLHRPHRRNAFNFSLRVDNIATDVRVRELKAALAERGVRPKDITWKGSKGFAMLHFRDPDEHENIIASLQDIKLREEGETLLVQLAQPTRIEVTDISSL